MPTNWWMFFVAALIPMLIGSLWYGKMMFGNKWMKTNGFTEESLQGGNMAVIFGVSYLFSVMVALTMSGMVIHQGAVLQMMMPDVAESGSAAQQQFNDLMAQYGGNFRDFGHGALHGGFAAVFFVLPIIGILSLFERRGWGYIGIHFGYWFITLLLMGGLLCTTLEYASLS